MNVPVEPFRVQGVDRYVFVSDYVCSRYSRDGDPASVIHPGSALDYRFHGNPVYFAETRTPWLRLWADWPSLQPDPLVIDDQARVTAHGRAIA